MPRLIFKCPYIKNSSKRAAHAGNYVRYIATREGVEKLESPTKNFDEAAGPEGYLQYIAQRPRVQKLSSHGLFSGTGESPVLSKAAKEVGQHPGNIWLPIISLRREDAERLGFNCAQKWQQLLTGMAPELANAMKIPLEHFRWYAAFHDEGTHPHVHMVCYSADGASGFLTKRGIEQIRSGLAREIFRQDLTEIYQRQTQLRDDLTEQSRETLEALAEEMQTGTLENERIEMLLRQLAETLPAAGRKQYGYLKVPLKSLVDEIVDELAKGPGVAAAYDLWYEQQEEILRAYKDNVPERVPLSRQPAFRQIKNAVIREADRLRSELEEPIRAGAKNEPQMMSESATAPQPQRSKPELLSATRLLHHLGHIFQTQSPQPTQGGLRPRYRQADYQERAGQDPSGSKSEVGRRAAGMRGAGRQPHR